jgi:hypothetical protein
MVSIDRCVNPLLSKAMGKRPALEWQLKRDWHLIVGDSLSRCCFPSRLRGPQANPSESLTLLVLPAWAAEIQHHSEVILEKIAVYAGFRAVERLHLQHTHRIPSLKKTVEHHVPPPEAQLPQTVAERMQYIDSPDLKARLASLARYVYRQDQKPS